MLHFTHIIKLSTGLHICKYWTLMGARVMSGYLGTLNFGLGEVYIIALYEIKKRLAFLCCSLVDF